MPRHRGSHCTSTPGTPASFSAGWGQKPCRGVVRGGNEEMYGKWQLCSGCHVESEAESDVSRGTLASPSCFHLCVAVTSLHFTREACPCSAAAVAGGDGPPMSPASPLSLCTWRLLVQSLLLVQRMSLSLPHITPPRRDAAQSPPCLPHHLVQHVLCLILCCLLSHQRSPCKRIAL